MDKEFVPYAESYELKSIGFDEPCFKNYNGNATLLDLSESIIYKTKAPTFSQAFRWFREKHNLLGQVNIHTYFICDISNDGLKMIKQYGKLTKTYEEAELACLRDLIEIVKSKQ